MLVALSLQPLRDTVRRLLLVAGVTSLNVLALLMLIARLLIARRLRPLDAITATATDIAGGDLVRPVPSLAGPPTYALIRHRARRRSPAPAPPRGAVRSWSAMAASPSGHRRPPRGARW